MDTNEHPSGPENSRPFPWGPKPLKIRVPSCAFVVELRNSGSVHHWFRPLCAGGDSASPLSLPLSISACLCFTEATLLRGFQTLASLDKRNRCGLQVRAPPQGAPRPARAPAFLLRTTFRLDRSPRRSPRRPLSKNGTPPVSPRDFPRLPRDLECETARDPTRAMTDPTSTTGKPARTGRDSAHEARAPTPAVSHSWTLPRDPTS